MRPQKIKNRCVKRQSIKAEGVIRTYDRIQEAFLGVLEKDESILSIQANVALTGLEEGEFTTDFLCQKANGDYCVRECVFRKKLILPRTCKLLDASRNYWQKRGITDWGIVVEKEGSNGGEE